MRIRIVDDQKIKDVKYLFSNSEREAPVEVDQTYEVSIDDLAREGDGIARVEGFVTVSYTHLTLPTKRIV